MKVISNATEYAHEFIKNCSFRSEDTYLGYDIVILDFNNILYDYHYVPYESTYQGLKNINDDDSFRLVNDIDRRKKELDKLLQLGKTIVIYTPINKECYVHTGQSETSGTGKNARVTRFVNKVSLLDIIPMAINTMIASGTNLCYTGGECFFPLWDENKKRFQYEAYFVDCKEKPLFKIEGTDFVVGFHAKVGNGNLILLPHLMISDMTNKKEEFEFEEKFYKTLITCIDGLYDMGSSDLPDWTKQYKMPDEQEEQNKLIDLENTLTRITTQIEEQKKVINDIQMQKILFTGTGDSLEEKIKGLFANLGFTIIENEPNRDDLILNYGDKNIVVEIKGLSKSAAEKNATQLEKWVISYHDKFNVFPKGILVVNTYRDLPLNERIEKDFPDQMLPFSNSRNHCLLTGVQLLCLYLYCEEHPGEKEAVINRLLNTVGIYSEFNWREFVSFSAT